MTARSTNEATVSRRVLGLNMAVLLALPLVAVSIMPRCSPQAEIILRTTDAPGDVGHLIRDISRMPGVETTTVRVVGPGKSPTAAIGVVRAEADIDAIEGVARRAGYEVAAVVPVSPSIAR